MKKMNNKGFSLVELIIVIAIMAVLVGVLAPQFLKYVESSRQSRDEQSMGEVNNAVKVACADEKVFSALNTGSTTVTFGGGTAATNVVAGNTALQNELNVTVGLVEPFSSKKYKGRTATTTVSVNTSNWSVTVETTCPAGDPFTVK